MNSIQICFAVTCTLLWLANPTTSHPAAPPKAAPKAPDTKTPAAKPEDKPATPPANAPAAAAKPSTPQGANKMAALSKDMSAVTKVIEAAVKTPITKAMKEMVVVPMEITTDLFKIGMDIWSQ